MCTTHATQTQRFSFNMRFICDMRKQHLHFLSLRHFAATPWLILTDVTISNGAPIVYTDEALYLADLAALGYSAIHESFEDSTVWADSRNSTSNPGSTPSVISRGIVWTSNYTANKIVTGIVGGSAPDGSFAIYSLPHGMTTDSGSYCDLAQDPDIPIECFHNDGLNLEKSVETGLHC